jgi:hypothetical protein
MRLAAFVLSIVVTGAIAYSVYCYRIELGLVSQRANATGPAPMDSRAPDWRIVDRSADGFKVEMPAEVVDSRASAFSGYGVQEEIPLIEASPRPDNRFAVAWDDDPPVERSAGEEAESTLDRAQAGALARTRAVLTGEWQSHTSGHPERDFTGRIAGGGALNARLILAGKRLFMLIVTSASASPERDGDVKRFFNSFQLTEPARAN